MNAKVHCPHGIWYLWVGIQFLDTDSNSALSQNHVAQQERTHCESFGHNQDNDAEDALEKFKVFMKCRIREKKNSQISVLLLYDFEHVYVKYCKF